MSYKVFADNQILCSPEAEELALIDPVVNLEANMAGSFTFKMAPDHPFYDSLVFRTTIIDVYLDDELIFEGFPVTESTDFYNVKTVECEGELSFLNDSVQGQAKYSDKSVSSLLTEYLTIHNSETDNFKQFQLGIVTVNGGNSIMRYTNYQTTMAEINEDLIDNFGGFLRVRHDNGVRYLDYLESSPRTSSQVIQIGKNLLDLTQNLSSLNICTVLIPLGARQDSSSIEGLEERLTIKSVNDNKDFIIGTGAAYYGYVWRTVTWDDVTIASNLLAKGEAYLQDAQWANLVINATAFDLGLAVEDVQKFRILDTIRVVSEPHGLDRNFMLTKLQLDLNHPGNTKITLGSDENIPLSSQSAALSNEINNQAVTILSSAAENAKMILENATGGNIHFVYDEDGVCVEILIMDTNDIQTATKIWRWNINGLGYSPDGGEHYTVAATMDGALFANFVRTGVLQDAATMGDKFYLNLDTGVLRGAFQSLTIAGSTVNQIAAGEVNSFVTGQYATDLANLQSQIDGQIETYFDNYVPTTSNAPANTWTTTAMKDDHLGDLFYVIDNVDHGGECYRWVKDGNTYKWQLVEDSAVATALQKALEALDLADEKRRVFTTTPTTPYDVGDLWVDTQTGEIMYCINAKTDQQSYSASDWAQAGDYVTDASLTQQDLFNRLTNNGQTQGIYLSNGKLYINATYIQSGTLSGIRVEAGSGLIGGWTLDNTHIMKDRVDSQTGDTYRAALYAPTTPSGSNAAFYIGILDADTSQWSFPIRLQYDGKLIATNAEIAGEVTATSGKIGGWTINSTRLYNEKELAGTTYRAGMYAPENSLATTSRAFYIRTTTDNDEDYPFAVTYGGKLTAKNADITGSITAEDGSIGGWGITATQLQKSVTIDNVTYKLGLQANDSASENSGAFYVSKTENNVQTFPFIVRYSGALTATNATITGRILAESGVIGNNSTNKITIGTNATNASIYSGKSSLDDTLYDGFYLGTDGFALGKGKFKVTKAGTLTATDANVTGTITSANATITGGTIKITTSSFTSDVIELNHTNGKIQLTPYGIYTTNTSSSTKASYLSDGIQIRNTSDKRIATIWKRQGYQNTGELMLYDNDKTRVFLSASNDGGLLYMYNSADRDIINLDVDSTYGATLGLYDNNRESFARLDKRGLYVFDASTNKGKDYSYVGQTTTSDNTTGSYVSSGSPTSINSLSLSGNHTYIITAHLDYPSNSTGRRALYVTTSSSGSMTPVNHAAKLIQTAVEYESTSMTCTFSYTTGQFPVTLYLTAYQNSGSALTVPSYMEAVCII